MQTRLATQSDANAVVELGRLQAAEAAPHLAYDPATAYRTFQRYLDAAQPVIFVVEGPDRAPVGFFMATIQDYAFTTGYFVGQEVLFVHPDHREGEAVSALMRAFEEWVATFPAREAYIAVANDSSRERIADLVSGAGYVSVAAVYRKSEIDRVR